jgi:hypothetical protein
MQVQCVCVCVCVCVCTRVCVQTRRRIVVCGMQTLNDEAKEAFHVGSVWKRNKQGCPTKQNVEFVEVGGLLT